MKALIIVATVILFFGATSATASSSEAPQSKLGTSGNSRKAEQKPWGIAGDPKTVSRTIALAITERIRLSFEDINVAEGETLKIILTNNGTQTHEFVMGTRQELEEDAARMLRFPNQKHEEAYIAQIPPGKTGEVIWTFNKQGSFEFSCPLAGHYQSGTVGRINVGTPK